jgi:hypothetical protein
MRTKVIVQKLFGQNQVLDKIFNNIKQFPIALVFVVVLVMLVVTMMFVFAHVWYLSKNLDTSIDKPKIFRYPGVVMAIINMAVGKHEDEARKEMESHGGANLRSIQETGRDFDNNSVQFTIWLYDTHIGLCLEDYERNGRDDSDWYMIVWNPTEKKTEHIEFASTRGWSYPCYGSKPDATDETKAAATEYARACYLSSLFSKNRTTARTPVHGRAVKVVKGYTNKGVKVAVGTEGDIFWTGESQNFSGSRWFRPEPMIGFRALDGTRTFTKAANVEVLNPEQFETPVTELVEQAAKYVPFNWRSTNYVAA